MKTGVRTCKLDREEMQIQINIKSKKFSPTFAFDGTFEFFSAEFLLLSHCERVRLAMTCPVSLLFSLDIVSTEFCIFPSFVLVRLDTVCSLVLVCCIFFFFFQ